MIKKLYSRCFRFDKKNFTVQSRVNERRYEFGDSYGADDWVCAKIPHDGRIKKDCVPKA